MIISIGGLSGSGKESISELLGEKLGMKSYSVGEIRRKMAAERNITLSKLNDIGEKQDFTDKKVDNEIENLGKRNDNFIISGRLAHHFIPNSVKIFLKAHLRFRSERTYGDEKKFENFRDLGDAIASLLNREKSDQIRFKQYYEIDCNDELRYDLVLNRDHLTNDEIVEQIIDFLKKENILTEVA